MTASLTVTAAGAAPPPPRDTRAPSLDASLGKTSLRRFLKTRRITARVTSDERAALSLRLTASVGSRVYTLATAAAASGSADTAKAVVLRSRKSQLRPLRGARRVKLTLAVEGRDGEGNVGTARARRTLSR